MGTTKSNVFTIEKGYLKHTNTDWVAYLGVYVNGANTVWRHHNSPTAQSIANQTLKFYKKVCLDSENYWVEGNLTNVTCTQTLPQQIAKSETLALNFEAATGYALPDNVTVTGASESDPATFIVMDGLDDNQGRTYWKKGDGTDFTITHIEVTLTNGETETFDVIEKCNFYMLSPSSRQVSRQASSPPHWMRVASASVSRLKRLLYIFFLPFLCCRICSAGHPSQRSFCPISAL